MTTDVLQALSEHGKQVNDMRAVAALQNCLDVIIPRTGPTVPRFTGRVRAPQDD